MDYGNIVTRSWNIVWGNKFMFLLGFLAALGSGGGSGGGGNGNFNFSGDDLPGSPDFGTQAESFFLQYGGLIFAAICLFAILGIVLWVIGLAARGGLISSAARIDAGETVTFKDAFRAGWSKVGRLVGTELLLYLPFIIIVIIFTVVVFGAIGLSAAGLIEAFGDAGNSEAFAGAFIIIILAGCGLLCLLFPLGIVLTGISAFAQRGIMLQELGIVDGIRHGWQIFKSNLGNIIVLAIIFVVIGLIVTFAAGIILLPFAFLAVGPAFLDFVNGNSLGMIDVITLVVGGFVLIILGAIINSIVTALQSTAFTLAYQEFLNKKDA
ncbi:MAG: hypothetical protein AAF614_24015 [Chloroflexota bacterium]